MTCHHRPALHHLAALALLSSSLPALVTAEDLDAEDVPPECAQLCAPVVQLTSRCEAQAKQQVGIDRRWDAAWDEFPPRMSRPAVVRSGRKRRLRRMEERLERRQSGSDSDSDSEAEDAAARACVCGERAFDVPAAVAGCAACIGRNATAVEADEDIKEIIAECGFAAAVPPPAPAAPAAPAVTTTRGSTVPPANLAPVISSSAPPPPPPPPPASTTTTSTTTTTTTTTSSEQPPPVAVSPTPDVRPPESSSVTPVTVFATPSFRTLPGVIVPNDFPPARSDVQAAGADALAIRGWKLGTAVTCSISMAILVLGY